MPEQRRRGHGLYIHMKLQKVKKSKRNQNGETSPKKTSYLKNRLRKKQTTENHELVGQQSGRLLLCGCPTCIYEDRLCNTIHYRATYLKKII